MKRGKFLKIIDENIPIGNYTIDDLYNLKSSNQKIVATVSKFHEESGIILDLGNDLLGYMYPSDFEDSEEVSNGTIISFIGRNIMAYIEDIVDNTVYLSRAKVQKEYKENFLTLLEPGTIIDTRVLSIAPFGVFVDLGYGVLGLLPIGDVSIARFPSIFDVFSVGDDIKVVYKGLYATGYVVTHKELLGTWEENLKEFKMGEYCQGIVRDLKPYGAFIEITPNLTGLAEIPEYMDLDIGDSVCVKLKNTNPEKLKVKLSIVSKSNSEYKLKFKYKITQGVIKEWNYTPFGSMKCIKTEFD